MDTRHIGLMTELIEIIMFIELYCAVCDCDMKDG